MKSDSIKYLLAVTIYGTIGLFIRYVNASSEFIVFCRGTIGSLFIAIVMLIKRQKIDFKAISSNLSLLAMSGVCLGLNWVFLFSGYKRALALTSLCNYTAPIFVVIISTLFLKEKINFKQIICIITSFVGVVLISGIFDSRGVDLYCIVCGMLAAACFVGLVLLNRRFKNIKDLDKTIIQLAFSAITVLPYMVINSSIPTSLDTTSIIILILLGIVHTGIAYILYFSSIDTLPVEEVAVLGYIEPALSVIIGILILQETSSLFSIIGAIVIIVSAILIELFKER